MIIALIVLISLIGIRFLWYYLTLWYGVGETDIWMTYDQFIALYSIDPQQFSNYHLHGYGPCLRYCGEENNYFIYFKSLFDWWRAEYVIAKNKKIKDNATRTKYTLQFINEIKKKIEKAG